MFLRIKCSKCQTICKVPEESRGKKLRCPKCSTVVRIPALQDDAVTDRNRAFPFPAAPGNVSAPKPRNEAVTSLKPRAPARDLSKGKSASRNNRTSEDQS